MNLDRPDNSTQSKPPSDNTIIPCSELGTIYSSTFQHVGQKFLDSLMQQITIQTKAQSTLLLQLLSLEEYRELSRIYSNQNNKFHVMNHDNNNNTLSSSPDMDDSSPQHPTQVDSSYNILQDQFLLIRSCFSNGPFTESM